MRDVEPWNQLITSFSTATTQNESGTTYLLRDLSVSRRPPPLIRYWSHQRLGFVSLLWVSRLIFFLGFVGVFGLQETNWFLRTEHSILMRLSATLCDSHENGKRRNREGNNHRIHWTSMALGHRTIHRLALILCIRMRRGDSRTKLQDVVGSFTTHAWKRQGRALRRSVLWRHH